MNAEEQQFSYDSSIKEIEEIVTMIEAGNLPIDELLGKVKRAAGLINQCRAALHTTQEAVEDVLGRLSNN